MEKNDGTFQLIHEPAGRQHPYEYSPFERKPRTVVCGETVIFGAVTCPAEACEELWAEWQYQGENEVQFVKGNTVETTDLETHWSVEFPAFNDMKAVDYRIYGKTGNQVVCSDLHSFYPAAWKKVIALRSYDVVENSLRMKFQLDDQSESVQLCARFYSGWIQFDWGSKAPPLDNENQALQLSTRETGGGIEVEAGKWRLAASFNGSLEIFSSVQSMLKNLDAPTFLIGENGKILKIRQVSESPRDEAFYGFGERFNSLNQRGNTLDVRVYDQYKNQQKRTYLPVPFFFSSRGYGIYLDTNRYVNYDLAASLTEAWQYESEMGEDGSLRFFLIDGPEPKSIIGSFTQLTGRPKMPPEWAFGLWMSSNDWDSQEKVLEAVNKSIEHKIPASVLVIEAWSDEVNFYIWNDAKYDVKPPAQPFHYTDFIFPQEGKWPDPKGMIDTLHKEGIKLVLWQIPVLKKQMEDMGPQPQHDADEVYMIEKGYCVHQPDKKPYYVRSPWFPGSLLMDFTNQEAVDWWFSKRTYLVEEMGVDGMKTDGGEHLWSREARFSDGRTGEEMWNLYPYLYEKEYSNFIKSLRGGDAVLFSRSGFTGAQQFSTHWAGDENSTWEAFRSSILAMLNAGLSGMPFMSWDLAGFGGDIPTAELYLRAAGMSVFSPIMQYHSEYYRGNPSRDRTPWNIQEQTGDSRVIPVFRDFITLRKQLIPYILKEAKYSCETGLPMMRPLFLEFPSDDLANKFPYQYLFGSDYLVAPVVEPDVEKMDVYLPAGVWKDFWSEVTFQGSVVVRRPCPINKVIVFEKVR